MSNTVLIAQHYNSFHSVLSSHLHFWCRRNATLVCRVWFFPALPSCAVIACFKCRLLCSGVNKFSQMPSKTSENKTICVCVYQKPYQYLLGLCSPTSSLEIFRKGNFCSVGLKERRGLEEIQELGAIIWTGLLVFKDSLSR